MGLRELKKTKTRQAVQKAAMCLIREKGYDATTVEQIAFAAEISTATFYRYYCDKEDVVLGDDERGLVEEILATADPDEPVPEVVAALFRAIAAKLDSGSDSDTDTVLVRLRLICEVPGLRARRWAGRQAMIDSLARSLAPRAGTHPDDHGFRLAIAIAFAAESETVFHWARTGGAQPLAALLDGALATIEPVLAPWSGKSVLQPAVQARETKLELGRQ